MTRFVIGFWADAPDGNEYCERGVEIDLADIERELSKDPFDMKSFIQCYIEPALAQLQSEFIYARKK